MTKKKEQKKTAKMTQQQQRAEFKNMISWQKLQKYDNNLSQTLSDDGFDPNTFIENSNTTVEAKNKGLKNLKTLPKRKILTKIKDKESDKNTKRDEEDVKKDKKTKFY